MFQQALYRMEQENHYMGIGGQCGQSCPCCRASAFKSGVDNDGWFGALSNLPIQKVIIKNLI